MEIITVDAETYYAKDYSLTKLSMEAYIRDPRFQVIMLGIRMPDGTRGTITGTHEEIKLKLDAIPWDRYAVLAHNTLFDAAILSWVFGIRPALWLDTLSMANAIHHGKPNSLEKLAERYDLPRKLDYVLNALGKRREDFTPDEFRQYAIYCLRDVDICYQLFQLMAQGWYDFNSFDKREAFPRRELELIDAHIRMFAEPVLRLNMGKLQKHLADVQEKKEKLLSAAGISKEDLMSNPKFAAVLEGFGVPPPMKVSPTTKKLTYAFAKTDEGMKALLEHPDERVQAVAAARMGVKSTLEETRTERFIAIAERSPWFPVPLKYAAARTLRSGGTDQINLQNLPARGQGAGKLKECMEFPPGFIGCNSDSSNIEARMLAWWAMQDDLVADFAAGVDVYCKLATVIYGKTITKQDPLERFVGKTAVLGAGYSTGARKLQITLKAATPSVDLSLEECQRIIDTYRSVNYKIPELWRQADVAIQAMHDDKGMWLGREGVVWVDGKRGIKLPNGTYIQYPQLHRRQNPDTGKSEWVYKDRNGFVNIYGGKLVENCIAEGTPVLTDRGWVAIEKVLPSDLVHDGVEFVKHGGSVFRSVQACVIVDGVAMTPDHEVLTNDGWIPASQNPRPYRPEIRHAASSRPGAKQRAEKKLALSMRLRKASHQSRYRCKERSQTWWHPQLWVRYATPYVSKFYRTWNEQTSRVCGVALDERPVQVTNSQSLEKLRGARDISVSGMARFVPEFLARYGAVIRSRVRTGQNRQRWELQPRELPMGNTAREHHEQAQYYPGSGCSETKQRNRYIYKHDLLPSSEWVGSRRTTENTKPRKPVYDILNCGPRQRFVVLGDNGPFIVHNCTQALARIIVMYQLLKIRKRYRVALTVHDSVVALARMTQPDPLTWDAKKERWVANSQEARDFQAYVEECMRWTPKWAIGCPINCESGLGFNYGEC